MHGDGSADIGEGIAGLDEARPQARAEAEDGHALARMVRAAPGGVAAMVGRQDDDVAGLQLAVHLRQTPVESFQRRYE